MVLAPAGLGCEETGVRVIGLIGGIGAGKSTVAAMLAGLGAEVMNADAIGHEVYAPGTPGFAAVAAAFGREVIGADGSIDRKRLGAIVFADRARLERLNAIVHPLIRAEIERRIAAARRNQSVRAVVVEAAILLDAGWRDLVDEVWVVSAGRDRLVGRLQAQRGLSAEETDARRAQQMSDGARRAAADVVVENDGSVEDLRARIATLWSARIVSER